MTILGIAPSFTTACLPPNQPQASAEVQRLLSVLSPALLRLIHQQAHWHVMTFVNACWFNPPSHFIVDEKRLDQRNSQVVLEFYTTVARFFSQNFETDPDFDRDFFTRRFASAAIRRLEGERDYVPPATNPTPTAIFLEMLWHADEKTTDLRKIWQEAIETSEKRQAYHVSRQGTSSIIPSRVARVFGSVTEQTVRLLKQYQWEAGFTLQGAVDPSTLKNETTFSIHGLWERISMDGLAPDGSSWHADPRMAMEGRFRSPFLDSDLLLLGGWQVHVSSESDREMHLLPQIGYSVRRLAYLEQFVPGAEISGNLTGPLGKKTYWQLSAVIRQGLSLNNDPKDLSAGIYLSGTM